MEAADEDDHSAELLNDDGTIGDERPEFIGAEARVTLQCVEECRFIGVIIWIC